MARAGLRRPGNLTAPGLIPSTKTRVGAKQRSPPSLRRVLPVVLLAMFSMYGIWFFRSATESEVVNGAVSTVRHPVASDAAAYGAAATPLQQTKRGTQAQAVPADRATTPDRAHSIGAHQIGPPDSATREGPPHVLVPQLAATAQSAMIRRSLSKRLLTPSRWAPEPSQCFPMLRIRRSFPSACLRTQDATRALRLPHCISNGSAVSMASNGWS